VVTSSARLGFAGASSQQHMAIRSTAKLDGTIRGAVAADNAGSNGREPSGTRLASLCLVPRAYVSRPLVNSVSARSIMMMRTYEMVGGWRIDRRLERLSGELVLVDVLTGFRSRYYRHFVSCSGHSEESQGVS
jgi:hypothetical protein